MRLFLKRDYYETRKQSSFNYWFRWWNGLETAKRFVEEGATVIISDLKEDVVNQSVDTLSKETNQKVYGYVLDVSKEASVEDTFSNIKHDIGKLDILINCAGITGADKTTDQLTEEEWDQVLQSM